MDFTMPDFSVPDLMMTDLSMPSFSMPDVHKPDPMLPDLMSFDRPPDLDILDVNLPDSPTPTLPPMSHVPNVPMSLDLSMSHVPNIPDVPMSLDLSMSHVPNVPNVSNVSMSQRPGEMDSSALELVRTSPDDEHLPPDLTYDHLKVTDGMSTRDRHLGMLLLGLEGEVELSDAPHPY